MTMSPLKGLVSVLTLVVFAASACSQPSDNWQQREDMAGHSQSDIEMVQAIDNARETLPEFWNALSKNDPEYDNFSIKVGLIRGDDGLEHIWVADLSQDGEKITGTLDNEPADLPKLRIGDSVSFTKQQVTDWQYVYNGKFYGHHTTRVLIKNMSLVRAEETRKMLGWD